MKKIMIKEIWDFALEIDSIVSTNKWFRLLSILKGKDPIAADY